VPPGVKLAVVENTEEPWGWANEGRRVNLAGVGAAMFNLVMYGGNIGVGKLEPSEKCVRRVVSGKRTVWTDRMDENVGVGDWVILINCRRRIR
jgi:hypothetical protein